MKKFLLVFLLLFAINLQAGTSQDLGTKVQYQNTLISAAQDLTGSWVDLGSEIDVRKFNTLTLWLVVDINNSLNARVRILGLHTSGGTEYQRIIQTASTSSIAFQGEYLELAVDADINFVESFNVDAVSYVQVQVQAGTVGATAGQIDAAHYTLLFK